MINPSHSQLATISVGYSINILFNKCCYITNYSDLTCQFGSDINSDLTYVTSELTYNTIISYDSITTMEAIVSKDEIKKYMQDK